MLGIFVRKGESTTEYTDIKQHVGILISKQNLS